MNTTCHIGLGANLGRTEQTLRAATAAIAALPGTSVRACSSLYQTPAWGVTEQPAFLNAVVMIETGLAAPELLDALMQIERQHGRNRDTEQRWGPRTLDLDILLYGEDVIDLPGLRVPHPHLHERAFALIPLREIAAEAIIPGIGTVDDALIDILPLEDPPIQATPAADWSPP